MRILEHRNEIIAAVIGALTAGLLSLAVGLYSMNKTFQMSQSKELLLGLRLDISALKNVDRELDENIKLLLSNNYKISAELEPIEVKWPEFGKKKIDKEFKKWMDDYLQAIVGKMYVVKSVQLPPDRFVVGSWAINGPRSSDIDFELIQALNELYRKLQRANAFLDQMAELFPSARITEATRNGIENNVPRYNSAIAEVTQTKLVQVKNRITDEIRKLQKRRDEISL